MKEDGKPRWNIVLEEGREIIQTWRDKRLNIENSRKSYHQHFVCWLDFETLKGFIQNINSMVIIQIGIAVLAVYLSTYFGIHFDIPVSLFVSPIVFPLAFSINADFQRREKVLEDLAVFKSHGMVWYFCMREWKQAAELDTLWITAVHGKLKSLLFHLREYLLTPIPDHRKIILRAMYEDFSDANQLIEKIRASKLPANTAIVSRSVHLLNMMCLSFERLRVIREYRSPRSIRSFNKVFIMLLPIIFAPYFVHISLNGICKWESYYIAVLVAFVFSALQCVQDKLDDPFDGMSEDNINLDTIDEWTFGSLEHAMKRSLNISHFNKFKSDISWLRPGFKGMKKEDITTPTDEVKKFSPEEELEKTKILLEEDGDAVKMCGHYCNIPKPKDESCNDDEDHGHVNLSDENIESDATKGIGPHLSADKEKQSIQNSACFASLPCIQKEDLRSGVHFHDDNCMRRVCEIILVKCMYNNRRDISDMSLGTEDSCIEINSFLIPFLKPIISSPLSYSSNRAAICLRNSNIKQSNTNDEFLNNTGCHKGFGGATVDSDSTNDENLPHKTTDPGLKDTDICDTAKVVKKFNFLGSFRSSRRFSDSSAYLSQSDEVRTEVDRSKHLSSKNTSSVAGTFKVHAKKLEPFNLTKMDRYYSSTSSSEDTKNRKHFFDEKRREEQSKRSTSRHRLKSFTNDKTSDSEEKESMSISTDFSSLSSPVNTSTESNNVNEPIKSKDGSYIQSEKTNTWTSYLKKKPYPSLNGSASRAKKNIEKTSNKTPSSSHLGIPHLAGNRSYQ